MQTIWAGVNTNHRTLVRTKQSDQDPAGEVVSVHFQTNPGAVRLTCESEHTSVESSSKNHTPHWIGTRSVTRIMGIIV